MEGVSRFANLTTRPPTPPKDADVEKRFKTNDVENLRPMPSSIPLDTPHESPNSSDYFPRSSDKTSKRVDFVLNPSTIEGMSSSVEDVSSLTKIRQSANGHKPSKSILKTSNNPLSSDPPEHESLTPKKQDLATMLDELTHQLTSTDLSTRFDAYMVLNGCLKAYKNLPSQQLLEDKMPLLIDFVRRDICMVKIEEGARNTQLVVEAVKLIITFLWSPTLEEYIPDTFQSFILNHAISSIANETTPKSLTIQYLYFLAVQNFQPKIMTNKEASRLLAALKTIRNGDKVTSKRVLAHRLSIYKRLIAQARPLMIVRVADWIDNVLLSVLSPHKDVRERAVSLGIEAALAMGKEEHVSRAVRGVFNSTIIDEKSERKYADTLMEHMTSWMESDEDALCVPQIWSMIILFLRSQTFKIEKWAHIQPWLLLLEKCFNSSTVELKHQANKEWGRFVFAIQPTATTSDSVANLLLKPIRRQIDRCRDLENDTKGRAQPAKMAYCTLLYYAFRPQINQQGLSRFWKIYIDPVLSIRPDTSRIDTRTACRILVSLFGDGSKKLWDVNRANGAPITPDELPPLDVRWIRSRAGTILSVLETLLVSDSWWAFDDGEAFIMRVWRGFTKALSDAGNKEIKVSMEAMTAVAEIVGCLKRFFIKSWCTSTLNGRMVVLQRFSALVLAAVENMGPLPFTERRLLQSPQDSDSFKAAETPTSRSIKGHGLLASPIHHLFDLLSSSVDDEHVDGTYQDVIQVLLTVSLRPATSRRTRLGVLRDISRRIILKPRRKATIVLWEVLARAVSNFIEDFRSEEISSDNSQLAGQDFRDAMKIIEAGAQLDGENEVKLWADTLSKIEDQLLKEAGPGGSVVCIVEPLANLLQHSLSASFSRGLLEQCVILLSKVIWPVSRKDIERAQRTLWGSVSSTTKSDGFDPFNHLYSLVTELLIQGYQNLDIVGLQTINRALYAVTDIINSSPLPLSSTLIKRIQYGLGYWVEDVNVKMNTRDGDCVILFEAAVHLWETTAEKIERLDKFDSTLLSHLEALLRAGLSSKHKAIINRSVLMWNTTFGLADILEYPEDLRRILVRLSCITELLLPGVAVEKDPLENDSTPLQFAETPEKLDLLRHFENENSVSNTPLQRTPELRLVEVGRGATSLVPIKNAVETSSKTITPKRQSHSIPRMRHDDSQIEFAVVDFSPGDVNAIESQILTDRQREVRERQNGEAAAMFPDLRSSPTPKSRSQDISTPRLQIGTPVNFNGFPGPEDPHSPVLPPSDHMNTFLGSSPTPSQRRSSSRDKSSSRMSPLPQLSDSRQGDVHAISSPPSSPPLGPTKSTNKTSVQPTIQKTSSSLDHLSKFDKCQLQLSTAQPEILDVVNDINNYVMETEQDGPHDSEFDDSVFLNSQALLPNIIMPHKIDQPEGQTSAKTVDVFNVQQHPTNQLTEKEVEIDFEEEMAIHLSSSVEDVAMEGSDSNEGSRACPTLGDEPFSDPSDLISSQIALEMERASQNSASFIQSQSPSASLNGNSEEQETENVGTMKPTQPKKRGRPSKEAKHVAIVDASALGREERLDYIVLPSPRSSTDELDTGNRQSASNNNSTSRTSKKRSQKEMEDEVKAVKDTIANNNSSKTAKRARVARTSQQDASTDSNEDPVLPRKLRARHHPSSRTLRSGGMVETNSTPEKMEAQVDTESKTVAMAGKENEVVDHQPAALEQASSVTKQAMPGAEASQDQSAVAVKTTTQAATTRVDLDLTDQLGALMDRAKQDGIAPEQRRSVMLMSMELMKMAMDP